MGRKLLLALVLLALVVSSSSYFMWRWRLARELNVVSTGELSAVKMTAKSVSPDGRYLAVGDGERFVGLADAFGQRLWRYALALTPNRPVQAVAVSNDARRVVAATQDGRVYFFDANAKPLWRHDIGRKVTAVAVSADGRKTAVASDDGVVWVLDGRTPAWKRAVPHGAFSRLIIVDSGRRVIGVSRGTLVAVEPSGSRAWRALREPVIDAAADPAGNGVFAVTGKRVALLDADGRIRHGYRPPIGSPASLGVAADGRRLAVVTADNDILVVDRENNAPIWYRGAARGAVSGAFLTGRTKMLVLASGDRFDALDLGRSLADMRRVARQARIAAAGALAAVVSIAIVLSALGRRPPTSIEIPADPVKWREAA